LSYARQDYFFAEMLGIKLAEAEFAVWRDHGSIRAGDDWRRSIEDGIAGAFAVVVALSTSSAESVYVTYEWAYAIGLEKPVIPVKLSDCKVHPRLEPMHYIDFSYSRSLPWDDLIRRLREIDAPEQQVLSTEESKAAGRARQDDGLVTEILDYFASRGFTMASFQRLSKVLPSRPNESVLKNLLQANPDIFRPARIKGGLDGLAKRVP
jgi:hypothetical protein